MRCTTLIMVSFVVSCLLLSLVEESEAGAPPVECWSEILFSGKCGFHGKKKCYKEMESKLKQRVLKCRCEDVKKDSNTSKDEHYCGCQRENPYECN
ncbi:Defensin-like protein 232 [Arabidopsis thaliana]|uniref:Defensin-like protein 232 n=3 Tax=Arabidopsis TaxID=3701 RepID=DF232_ARATH|nr:SCR-like 23 [Arabidopsis thaliana]P82642.1 RecName: Full=Defensin-like protein 232; AltName: Full=S locus cysteine-rich-like protein 23; Short=Protein SCRL23; Short=SCR-like protein 23; Flags: Precursor [Arabidopsis thaliana]KAG7616005.1 Plant self-incompatibility response [Arabidopsis thaliana x Arabidopsis arenosa]AEE83498.1 SCR-like 23 [Arabidopsis thaliana]OAO98212.1 SCRL23 [Arabidopsis thaliana]CAA0395263.1 unnamed protein product [Arabidopsis thaliana]VYS62707.1 unnamed protein produ|eukprot:NP_001031643.1 SCR-like 23 [Arabidopsis thaliana]